MIANDLIARLHSEAGARMSDRLREGRLHALRSLQRHFDVFVTEDGTTLRRLSFHKPPTAAEVAALAPDSFVVCVKADRGHRPHRVS